MVALCVSCGEEPGCERLARPVSALGRYLEAEHCRATYEGSRSLEASLYHVVDTMLRAEHTQSERRRPCARKLLVGTTEVSRARMLSWMVKTFDILGFDDDILHGVTLTLDRYFATLDKRVEEDRLQMLLLAALCVELKANSSGMFPDGSWKRYVVHLCQGQTSIEDILRVETEMLSRLGFVMGVPTPFSFLRTLSVRLRGDANAARLVGFASFLLELALFEPELEYGGRPHSLLAAAALSGAFRALDMHDEGREELLADVAAFLPDWADDCSKGSVHGRAREQILECELELLQLWRRSAEGAGPCSGVLYATLQAKYAHESRIGPDFSSVCQSRFAPRKTPE
eukprot:TRINITY_DN27411_c0_g1_i1.p1 TRINITY_DN27411_c0_g1~~TRINITY_DN27411_c0_g1_i1.p1  ORF type:complete len:350 (+),score=52.13 TRINITY_DN27411_c0_g1_i1:24-1052(+)